MTGTVTAHYYIDGNVQSDMNTILGRCSNLPFTPVVQFSMLALMRKILFHLFCENHESCMRKHCNFSQFSCIAVSHNFDWWKTLKWTFQCQSKLHAHYSDTGPSQFAVTVINTGLTFIDLTLFALQVHHCCRAWFECAGLSLGLHLLSVWRSRSIWCCNYAVQCTGR